MTHHDTKRASLLHRIETVTESDFDALAMDIFHFQAQHNALYQRFLSLLGRKLNHIHTPNDIPYLPITLFKKYRIKAGNWASEAVFTSSGTTGTIPSRHYVRSLSHYLTNAHRGFEAQYGSVQDYCFLALLPSYLERKGSSLVCMADHFISLSAHRQSGFFLYEHDRLVKILKQNLKDQVPTVLLGVTYALLDLADRPDLPSIGQSPLLIMETGGMKGRRKEMTRPEVHETLKAAFGTLTIHSEYGMTELLSQAYAPTDGIFIPSPTMRVHTTELNDPFCRLPSANSGIINITDLANLDSIAFIATEDLGRVHPNRKFEIIGRADVAEMRGCNLMVE